MSACRAARHRRDRGLLLEADGIAHRQHLQHMARQPRIMGRGEAALELHVQLLDHGRHRPRQAHVVLQAQAAILLGRRQVLAHHPRVDAHHDDRRIIPDHEAVRHGAVAQHEIALGEMRLMPPMVEHAAAAQLEQIGIEPGRAGPDVPPGALDHAAVGVHPHELHGAQAAHAQPGGEAVAVGGREVDAVELLRIELVPLGRARRHRQHVAVEGLHHAALPSCAAFSRPLPHRIAKAAPDRPAHVTESGLAGAVGSAWLAHAIRQPARSAVLPPNLARNGKIIMQRRRFAAISARCGRAAAVIPLRCRPPTTRPHRHCV